MTYPRIVSDNSIYISTGKEINDWFEILDEAGARRWSGSAARLFLSENYGLDIWWQRALYRAYDSSRQLNQVGIQRDGRYRCSVNRTVEILPEDLWSQLSADDGVFDWLGSPVPVPVQVGSSIDLGDDGTLTLTDFDDIGWLRFERSRAGIVSVAHIALRPRNKGGTKIEIAESNISDAAAMARAHRAWSMVADCVIESWLVWQPTS